MFNAALFFLCFMLTAYLLYVITAALFILMITLFSIQFVAWSVGTYVLISIGITCMFLVL